MASETCLNMGRFQRLVAASKEMQGLYGDIYIYIHVYGGFPKLGVPS